jgi:hypothetical protein
MTLGKADRATIQDKPDDEIIEKTCSRFWILSGLKKHEAASWLR